MKRRTYTKRAGAKYGRPTKLTPDVQARLCEAIRGGNFIDTAASFAGVRRETLHEWLRLGRNQKRGRYRDFVKAVDDARAKSEIAAVAGINKAGYGGHWQALAWRLERQFPDRWALVHRFKVMQEREIDGLLETLAENLRKRGLPDAVLHTVLDVLQEIAGDESQSLSTENESQGGAQHNA